MDIMKLLPVGKDYIWGGTRLHDEFDKNIDMTPLAETWECSVHPDGQSIIENGIFAGETLASVLETHPEYLGTKMKVSSQLPILVKFIDAKDNLSVQVHPDDEYAREHEDQNGKSEMWYVVDADEGASVIYGLIHPVTKDILRSAVEEGYLGNLLQKIPVHKGDVFYVPAGTVHAIGAGVLIAEIQESSNVTYRLYDYDRIDKNGKKRELKFDKAIEVMNMNQSPDIKQAPRLVHYYPGCAREILCRCKYFETERIEVSYEFSFTVYPESFQVILCLSGEAEIEDEEGLSLRFRKGDCLFLPAELGRCHITGSAEILKTRC